MIRKFPLKIAVLIKLVHEIHIHDNIKMIYSAIEILKRSYYENLHVFHLMLIRVSHDHYIKDLIVHFYIALIQGNQNVGPTAGININFNPQCCTSYPPLYN